MASWDGKLTAFTNTARALAFVVGAFAIVMFGVRGALMGTADASGRVYESALLGDSIAHRWPEGLRSRFMPSPSIDLGVNGAHIADVDAQVSMLRAISPSTSRIYIMVGANDVRDDSVDGLILSYRRLVRNVEALFPRAALTIFGILPRTGILFAKNAVIDLENQHLKAIAGRVGARFISPPAQFRVACASVDPCLYLKDSVHPNEDGYILLTNATLSR